MNIDAKAIGNRIRQIRGKRTQEQFAVRLNVPKQNYISRYERGRIPNPQLLVDIAHLGRVSVDWILTGRK